MDPWHFGTGPDPDPRLSPMDPDPALNPAIFDFQEANKKLFFSKFSAYYFLNVHLHR
jgi:hypothetical protein